MADEAQVLEEQEEVDVLSILAEQGQVADTEDDEDQGEIPDDAEALKAMLLKERELKSKRNRSLKKSKQAIHRTMEENEALRKRLEEIERKVESRRSEDSGRDSEQAAREWAEKVADDPSQAIAYADWKQSQLEDKLAKYLGGVVEELRNEIGGLKGAVNPDMAKYRDKIAAIRESNEELADLDDAVLLKVAKVLDGTKVRNPRGAIGGRRPPRETGGGDFKLSDDERKAMGF